MQWKLHQHQVDFTWVVINLVIQIQPLSIPKNSPGRSSKKKKIGKGSTASCYSGTASSSKAKRFFLDRFVHSLAFSKPQYSPSTTLYMDNFLQLPVRRGRVKSENDQVHNAPRRSDGMALPKCRNASCLCIKVHDGTALNFPWFFYAERHLPNSLFALKLFDFTRMIVCSHSDRNRWRYSPRIQSSRSKSLWKIWIYINHRSKISRPYGRPFTKPKPSSPSGATNPTMVNWTTHHYYVDRKQHIRMYPRLRPNWQEYCLIPWIYFRKLTASARNCLSGQPASDFYSGTGTIQTRTKFFTSWRVFNSLRHRRNDAKASPRKPIVRNAK